MNSKPNESDGNLGAALTGWRVVLYHAIRLLPLALFPLFGTIPNFFPTEALRESISRILVCAALLLTWAITEAGVMLWLKAKSQNSPKQRGYLIVIFLVGIVVLGLLQIFRSKVTQPEFFLILGVLSMRGIERSSFDLKRYYLGIATSFCGGFLLSLLAVLFFLTDIQEILQWQWLLIASCIGAQTTSLSLTRYGTDSSQYLSFFRASLFLPLIGIGTLAFLGQLPLCFSAVYILLFWVSRVAEGSTKRAKTTTIDFLRTASASVAFFCIILVCRLYESGFFSTR